MALQCSNGTLYCKETSNISTTHLPFLLFCFKKRDFRVFNSKPDSVNKTRDFMVSMWIIGPNMLIFVKMGMIQSTNIVIFEWPELGELVLVRTNLGFQFRATKTAPISRKPTIS